MILKKTLKVLGIVFLSLILLVGIAHLLRALAAMRMQDPAAGMMTVFSVITVICGAVICFNPFSAVTTLVRIIGVIFVYNGITGFWIEAKKR